MKLLPTPIADLLLIEPDVFGDHRGFFIESYHQEKYAKLHELLNVDFLQDNQSRSSKNILRGLHFQNPNGQGKLVRCSRGAVYDVAVDIRVGSPTFGQSFGVELNDENHWQLYIPPGFAHGFCVLSESADFSYKCTEFYQPQNEGSILWNDPALKINWPITEPILSQKDQNAVKLADFPIDKLPCYRGK
ncbi:MAG: dTDP-4-dehydrorhamnose 3,5-epimerase [Lentisphaeria bacterium]